MNVFRKIEPFDVIGKSVLDFGCGQFNPHGFSILLYVNGASRCVAYEPSDVSLKLSNISKKELIFAVLENTEEYRFTDISIKEMRERICNIDVEFYQDKGNISGSFDLVFSRSVLEHVQNLSKEVKFLAGICHGKQIHRVNFSDHRFARADYHPFLYMEDGDLHNINGLLPSEMRDVFERCGLIVDSYEPVFGEPYSSPSRRYTQFQTS